MEPCRCKLALTIHEILTIKGIEEVLITKLSDSSDREHLLVAKGRNGTGRYEMLIEGKESFENNPPQGLQELVVKVPSGTRSIRNFGASTDSPPSKNSVVITIGVLLLVIGMPSCLTIQSAIKKEAEKNDAVARLVNSSPNRSNYAGLQDQLSSLLKKYCKEENPGWLSSCGTSMEAQNYSLSVEQMTRLSSIKDRLDKIEEEQEAKEALERSKAIANGSYTPSESEITPACKQIVESRSVTGSINWGWFNSEWFPQYKTVILKGKTENRFGVSIPFSAECKWEKGGSVRLVEIND